MKFILWALADDSPVWVGNLLVMLFVIYGLFALILLVANPIIGLIMLAIPTLVALVRAWNLYVESFK